MRWSIGFPRHTTPPNAPHRVDRPLIVSGVTLAQQLRELGVVGGDPPRLVAGEKLSGALSKRKPSPVRARVSDAFLSFEMQRGLIAFASGNHFTVVDSFKMFHIASSGQRTG
jgi:hypothetical protein